MIANIKSHFGFSRMPFGKDIAAGALHQHKSHAEAVARISWCIAECATGLVTGEVGSGKTTAVRAATSTLDPRRHSVIYLGCPAIGARGIYAAIVSALGAKPRFHNASLIPQAQAALAAEVDERGRRVVLLCDLCTRWDYAALMAGVGTNAVTWVGWATRTGELQAA